MPPDRRGDKEKEECASVFARPSVVVALGLRNDGRMVVFPVNVDTVLLVSRRRHRSRPSGARLPPEELDDGRVATRVVSAICNGQRLIAVLVRLINVRTFV